MADLGGLVARIAQLEGENAALRERLGEEPWPEKIALAMITEKQVPSDVLGQWVEILRRAYFPGPHYRMRPLYPVQGRNQVAAQALDRPPDEWQHLYWQDSDMSPDVGMAERLRELIQTPEYRAPNGGVLCGAYYARDYPHEIQLFEPQPQKKGLYYVSPLRWIPALITAQQNYLSGRPSPLIPIGGGGTGSMLIRRDVLQRMQDIRGRGNVFWEAPISDEVRAEMTMGTDGWKGEKWSEDIQFCIDVHEHLGVQVYADTDLRLSSGHQTTHWVSPRDYIDAHAVRQGLPPAPQEKPIPPGYGIWTPNRQQRRALLRQSG